jgi:hypothetical protein
LCERRFCKKFFWCRERFRRRRVASVLRKQSSEGRTPDVAERCIRHCAGSHPPRGQGLAAPIQNDSGLPQGPAGASGASCACGKLAQRVPEGSPCSDLRRRQLDHAAGLRGGRVAARGARVLARKAATIGFFSAGSVERLHDLGGIECYNVVIEYRWAPGGNERFIVGVAGRMRPCSKGI